MGFWRRFFGRGVKASNNSLELFREIFGGRESATGRSITAGTALEITTVLRCVGVVTDGVATVPLKLMQKDADGRRVEVTDHPLSDVLRDAPNEWQDSLEFRETLAMHLALVGNAFCFINRVRGRVVELLPLDPGRVQVKRHDDLSVTYIVQPEGGGPNETFPAEAIWHLRGPSWNSWFGLEPVKLAREALGLSLALEEAHARLHRNGVQSTGAYSVEGNLSEEQQKRLTAWIKRHHAGSENVGVPLILDKNAKWLQLRMSGVDAEHLATRRHQIEEICRACGVWPIMVGHANEQTTFASAEQMFLAHAVHTIRPWHRRFEASIRRNLLTEQERRSGLYPKFFDGELMRGASKERGEFYARALGWGGGKAWMEVNEVRGLEDWDDVPWGSGEPIPPRMAATGAGGSDTMEGGNGAA